VDESEHAAEHFSLGLLLDAQGGALGAEAEYRIALALNPTHVSAHSNLGLLLDAQGDTLEAEVEYRAAIALNPTDADAHSNLASLLYDKCDALGAEAECRTALVWGSVLSPLHISCYWRFDRSVEFLFEDKLLTADVKIIRCCVSTKTASTLAE
jgi:tetratricopeptide (TPR) repeat protein